MIGTTTPRLRPAQSLRVWRLSKHAWGFVQPDFTLTFCAIGGVITAAQQWIENFDLPVERARGLDDRDNHLQVGEACLELSPGRWVGIVGSLNRDPYSDLEAALACRQRRQRNVVEEAAHEVPVMARAPDWIRQLLLAADSFVFARPMRDHPAGRSVIAGYPWFGDWGRDTMISLPGLTLAAGRRELARDILLTFAHYVEQGMLPNVFPGAGETPEYNTVDAGLWFIEAWRAYIQDSDDRDSLVGIFPVLAKIIEWHLRGTRYGIVSIRRMGSSTAISPNGCGRALSALSMIRPVGFTMCSMVRLETMARSARTRFWR